MSTRSNIIAKTPSGYAGIYCHLDGYEEGVGKTLLEHYQDPEKVAELIALGDISYLSDYVNPIGEHNYSKPERGVTVAYGRDRGESGTEAEHRETLQEVIEYFKNSHNGYVYVFDGKTWKVNGQDLAERLKEIQEKAQS